MSTPTWIGTGLADPQLALSIGADGSQTTYAAIAEAGVATGGTGSYIWAWSLQRDDGTNGSSRLSSLTVQAPGWTPDRAGWWEVVCTVTCGTGPSAISTTAKRRVKVTMHIQAIDTPLSTLVMVPS